MAIALKQLRFHYPNRPKQRILDIPTWTVPDGTKVFIHGPSGGGKSTLLNLLGGLLSPTEGTMQILGHTLNTMSRRQRDRFRAQHIGFVFQQFNLIPYLSAIDNIQLAAHFAKANSKDQIKATTNELLNELNIAPADRHIPTRHLSIGQQQRVAIARALINKPSLLIADEPTSSLDSANRESFMNLLMNMVDKQNMTLVFVSHDLSLKQHFTQVHCLDDFNQKERV